METTPPPVDKSKNVNNSFIRDNWPSTAWSAATTYSATRLSEASSSTDRPAFVDQIPKGLLFTHEAATYMVKAELIPIRLVCVVGTNSNGDNIWAHLLKKKPDISFKDLGE